MFVHNYFFIYVLYIIFLRKCLLFNAVNRITNIGLYKNEYKEVAD